MEQAHAWCNEVANRLRSKILSVNVDTHQDRSFVASKTSSELAHKECVALVIFLGPCNHLSPTGDLVLIKPSNQPQYVGSVNVDCLARLAAHIEHVLFISTQKFHTDLVLSRLVFSGFQIDGVLVDVTLVLSPQEGCCNGSIIPYPGKSEPCREMVVWNGPSPPSLSTASAVCPQISESSQKRSAFQAPGIEGFVCVSPGTLADLHIAKKFRVGATTMLTASDKDSNISSSANTSPSAATSTISKTHYGRSTCAALLMENEHVPTRPKRQLKHEGEVEETPAKRLRGSEPMRDISGTVNACALTSHPHHPNLIHAETSLSRKRSFSTIGV